MPQATIFDINLDLLAQKYAVILAWLKANVFISSISWQLVITMALVLMAYALARFPAKQLKLYLERRWPQPKYHYYNLDVWVSLIFPTLLLVSLWIASGIAENAQLNASVFIIFSKLLLAWIVIRCTTSLVRSHHLSMLIAATAWIMAALSITGWMEPTGKLLDHIGFKLGKTHISVLLIVKALLVLMVLLWLAGALSRLFERSINRSATLTPSIRVLLAKLAKIALVIFAFAVGLNTLGIDLTALTVFGGAIGLGLGFGLQKVVSNLVCGIILLLDRSIKPGDVIEVGNTYGWVNSLGARYVSVRTRDGMEHIIPNEQFITEKVVNWTYSDPSVRIKIPIVVSGDADVEQVSDIILSVARAQQRVLQTPAPVCQLQGFSGGLNFELRVWIKDPANGIGSIKSDIMLAILKRFRAEGITGPTSQQTIKLVRGERHEAGD